MEPKMKRSDEILKKASNENRGLTRSERGELREAYLWEKQEGERLKHRIQQYQKEFKENHDLLPRHIMYGKCANFQECPLDFKCRNYNPAYIKCVNCILHEMDGICTKDIHNPTTYNIMIRRGRIDLDENQD